ncbi:autotransporter outer membrane beta-barrel domain-containing protein [Methylophaga sp. OBS3]|uniref:autotransporter family protein n=1 Tax=Methylophaga sp. OBS3 TaxID=2991934 RepID=UPI00225B423D|nr:autotransporter outer membrane beta-barrel domain-containing protein [Methylophaga sp. OBS3]MCX4190825.1 autotransporter domain-containing protein [Methylophaga sp. OBS3]
MRNVMPVRHPPTLLSIAISIALSAPAYAASFTIENGETVTSGQTLNDNETGTIEAGGELSTSGIIPILVPGDNVIIENNGSIKTSGDYEEAIYSYSSSENTTIHNSGSITTSGNYARGIYSQGSNATINNSGKVETFGYFANGIESRGENGIISNSGSISINDELGAGIFVIGINSTIDNSGNITNSAYNNDGIYTSGSNAIISNSGDISMGGVQSNGIVAFGNDSNIHNSGKITTTGSFSSGIAAFGENSVTNNSGTIMTSGNDARSILSTGNNAIINNSGLVSATGVDSYAILGDSNDITLNLLSGSQIIGRIDLGDDGGDNDTANVYADGISSQLTFENTENINLFGTGVVSGNTVISVDPTGESTRGVALAGMTSSIHNVIGQRMSQTAPLKPVQLAALELSPGMYFEEHKPVAWAQVFGGRFDRDAEGSALGYDHNHVGMNFGYEWDISGHRAGLMGGIVRSKTDTQTASFETEADNYYIGAYANRKTHGLNITGSLIAGYGDHENDRLVVDNLNGFETAKSDFNSWFISPGVTLGSAFTVNERIELRPSVSVNYSIAWLDGYRESGTTSSNLSIDDRKAKALTARAQLAAAYQFDEASEFEFRVGMNSRHTNDDDSKVSIAGSQFKFATAGDESVTGGFAGASLRVATENNLSLIADMEFGGNSDENYAAGSISLEYVF